MRGLCLWLDRLDAVWRMWSQVIALLPTKDEDEPLKPINYRLLAGFNGGFDPTAKHSANMSYNNRTPTADCIGVLLWASGLDRLQPNFKGTRGEWLNCASLLDDAHGKQVFCRTLQPGEKAKPGDWLLTRDHCAMIVRPDPGGEDHLVIDCSPRHGRDRAVNTGYPWSDACEVIRPLIYKENQQAVAAAALKAA